MIELAKDITLDFPVSLWLVWHVFTDLPNKYNTDFSFLVADIAY